ncbi:MAG: hypothetical protein IE927_13015, partial [Rhodobacterales bacterium]|nr:hypothetical protein [Rhodobacterales bacterium]
PQDAARARPALFDATAAAEAEAEETRLGYLCPSGRYWEEPGRYDPAALRAVDALWLRAAAPARGRAARWQGWRPLRVLRNVAR